MLTEVQVSLELHQRITDNATKHTAVLIEIIPPDPNLQSYDGFGSHSLETLQQCVNCS